jgi:hypothetical protein
MFQRTNVPNVHIFKTSLDQGSGCLSSPASLLYYTQVRTFKSSNFQIVRMYKAEMPQVELRTFTNVQMLKCLNVRRCSMIQCPLI